jgi:predicted GIY-YIG superfamily endonuclease
VSKDQRAALFRALLRLCYVEPYARFVHRSYQRYQPAVAEHQESRITGFTHKYHLTRLVYFESFENVNDAIAREKQLKGWRRAKKIELIEALNPKWSDLSRQMN